MKKSIAIIIFICLGIMQTHWISAAYAAPPGIHTPIPIPNNMISNGDFESDVTGWQFGNINRALIQGKAQSGHYWLNTTNCASCPTGFGDHKTIAYDINGTLPVGQRYSASVYFRSPQGGTVEFVVWALGGTSELFSTFNKTGTGSWQKLEINNFQIQNSGHTSLRVQVYMKNIVDGAQYQFDNFSLTNNTSTCPTGYYTYQQPLISGAPTLADLFDKRAHFQNIQESQLVNLQFDPSKIDTGYVNGQPSKLSILYNPADGLYYTYSRAFGKEGSMFGRHFNMYLMSSPDGVNFQQIAPIFDQSVIQQMGDMYDGHIAIDYSVCPTRYIMALECSGSMCASSSTDPFNPSSWSRPVSVVSYDLNGHKSASTGVFLIDGNNKYASWTVVDDGPLGQGKDHDTGVESAYSRATAASNLLTYLGVSGIGSVIMSAESNIHCTSVWDCNNRDKQDWKKEGEYYYLIYNGANYYRCFRFPQDTGTNDWGNGIVRSTNPLGGYDLGGVGKMQQSLNTTICAVSYPVINAVNGELYMYYTYNNVPYDGGSQTKTARSKLVWNTPSATPLPGDLNHDGTVTLLDYNLLVADFGKTGTVGFNAADIDKNGKVDSFDYTILVGNFGKK